MVILAAEPALNAAVKRMKAIKAEAIERIKAGEEFFTEDGKVLALKEGTPQRHVYDADKVAELLGMPQSRMDKCQTIGIGALDEQYLQMQHEDEQKCSKAEGRKRMAVQLGSVLEVTHNRPSIVAVEPTTSSDG